MPTEIRSAEASLRPEIQVLRAACDSLVALDELRPEELEAVAAIVRDLSKRLPNPDDSSQALRPSYRLSPAARCGILIRVGRYGLVINCWIRS
jgi:hypothetical protein